MNNVIKEIYKTLTSKKNLHFLQQHKITILILFFLYILSDVLFINGSSDLRIFGMLFLYIIFIFIYKLKSRATFLFCLVLLAAMYFEFLLSAGSPQSEKAAVWLFFFLLIGILQQWKE